MSVQAMSFVFGLALDDPRDKFVLLAYANHADSDGGNIWPAVGRIAKLTEYTPRTVQRATQALEARGLLIPDGEGPQGTNKWRIDLDWQPESQPAPTQAPASSAASSDGGGDRESPPPRKRVTPPPVRESPEPSIDDDYLYPKNPGNHHQEMTVRVTESHPSVRESPSHAVLADLGIQDPAEFDDCEPAVVRAWMWYVENREGIENPAGYVARMLREGVEPPEWAMAGRRPEPKRMGRPKEPDEYVSAEYADFVES